MPFEPINSDHAIQQAQFGLVLSKPLSVASIDKLRVEGASWRGDLPAIEIPQIIEMRGDTATGVPRAVVIRGAEFSVKRPDGTAVTTMTILNNEVVVQTSLYTRWDPVWDKVQSYLLGGLDRIAALEKGRDLAIRNVSLVFVDAFRSSEESPDFTQVLVESPEVASGVLQRGPLWHCHTGWFESNANGRVLNQINVDAKKLTLTDPVSGTVSEPHDLSITHRQVTEFQPETALGEVVSKQQRSDIIGAFSAMHVANKLRVASLLTRPMREKIRIDQ
jgi:hypothetical protein